MPEPSQESSHSNSQEKPMKIDWKHVASTPGYKRLKAAYEHDVAAAAKEIQKGRKPMRDKAVFLKHFNWVISRAKHYAFFQKRPIEEVLNEWEDNRTYWWFGYYQPSNQPKLSRKNCLKNRGAKALRKQALHYEKSVYFKKGYAKRTMCNYFKSIQVKNEVKYRYKPRWDNKKRVMRAARLRREKNL